MSQKKSVSAKQVTADLRAGASNEFLIKKYGLSPKGLQSLFQKLLDAGLVTREDVYARNYEETALATDGTIIIAQLTNPPISVKVCPACKFPQDKEFETCPQCGVIVEKFLKKKTDKIITGGNSNKEPTQTLDPHQSNVTEIRLDRKAQEQIKRISDRTIDKAFDTARELQTRVVGSSPFLRMYEFVKTPKNAAIAGILGTLFIVMTGYLIFSKSEIASTNTPPYDPVAVEVARKEAERVQLSTNPARNYPRANSSVNEAKTTPRPSEYITPSPPPMREETTERRPPQPPKKFSSMEEARQALKCKDGENFISDFPDQESDKVEQYLAKAGSSLYYFLEEVKVASRNAAFCGEASLTDGPKFVVDLSGLPLAFRIPDKGEFLEVIGVPTSILSFKGDRAGERFCPVITPLVIKSWGGEIFQKQ
jgi:hypothetical protein